MLSVENYLLEYKRKVPNILLLWTIILVFIIISLIIINRTVTIKSYYQVQGIVKDENLSIYVLIQDLDKIIDNETFYIKDNHYHYKIKEIGEEVISFDVNFYKKILLSASIKEKDLIDNNVINLRFVVKEMTIFKYIVNLIKGE